jgi:N-acetylneuraminate synthase
MIATTSTRIRYRRGVPPLREPAVTTTAQPDLVIAGRRISDADPPYVIAELSGNHDGDIANMLRLITECAAAGVDAIKIQSYTADTLTIESSAPPFMVEGDNQWTGRTLHSLYSEAATPWEWTPELFAHAANVGVPIFSSPFDSTAVDMLEELNPPAYKIASFELVDLALIRVVAQTGRPMILSTGMATAAEIDEAVEAATSAGAAELALLRCNSAYPAPPGELDLLAIPDMRSRWGAPIGFSDHTLGSVAAIAAVALGASIIEKHVALDRTRGTDAFFSALPSEMGGLVRDVTEAHQTRGSVRYGASPAEKGNLAYRRSLFVVADIARGEELTSRNVRSIRPGVGLAPKHLDTILGGRAAMDVEAGTPLQWDHIAGP